MYSRIRVPAKWQFDFEAEHMGVADFKLGLGSCGKVVESLDLEPALAGIKVWQKTTDGERKLFFYPTHTLTGRIDATMV